MLESEIEKFRLKNGHLLTSLVWCSERII